MACPARTPSWAPPVRSSAGVRTDRGSLAHAAMQDWIESGDWREDVSGSKLAASFLELTEQTNTEAARHRLMASRMRVRSKQLRAHMADGGTDGALRCEATLCDEGLRLWGRPDVVSSGPNGTQLIDLKTGEREPAGGELSQRDSRQLLLYAHLVQIETGELPTRAAIFSLKRGLIVRQISSELVSSAVDDVLRAREGWERGERTARPTPENCAYCPQRARCEPSWQALAAWPHPDGVEGVVLRVETAGGVKAALRLATGAGPAWVTEIPLEAARHVEVKDKVRIIGARRIARPRGGTVFTAEATTQLLVVS